MASSCVCGSRLSAPPSVGLNSIALPELGAKVVVKGQRLRLKDALMRSYGMGWKDVEIQEEVIAKPKKKY